MEALGAAAEVATAAGGDDVMVQSGSLCARTLSGVITTWRPHPCKSAALANTMVNVERTTEARRKEDDCHIIGAP